MSYFSIPSRFNNDPVFFLTQLRVPVSFLHGQTVDQLENCGVYFFVSFIAASFFARLFAYMILSARRRVSEAFLSVFASYAAIPMDR